MADQQLTYNELSAIARLLQANAVFESPEERSVRIKVNKILSDLTFERVS